MNIKCIGCYELLREERDISNLALKGYRTDGKVLVTYYCPRFFPYATVISGLLRPGGRIIEAVEMCLEDPLRHCAVCPNTKITHYGEDIVSMCKEHGVAWSKWLDTHRERRDHLAPRGRVIKANWVEVFREFVESIRRQK